MANTETLHIEVVYALPGAQYLANLAVAIGTTVYEAVRCSGLLERFPEICPDICALGIYGRRVAPQQVLRNGDRVEIYRRLQTDPKQARRERAKRSRGTAKPVLPE